MKTTTLSEKSHPICLKINHEYFPELIKRVSETLTEVGSHKACVFDAGFWMWQYLQLPTHNVKLYGIFIRGKIMGYYHVPVYEGQIAGKRKTFAMVQEVAITKGLRGQGMFRKLAEFATQDLMASQVDLAYTFPNRNSIHTFLKYNGYSKICTLQSYLLPVRCEAMISSKVPLFGLEKIIGLGADLLFSRFSPPNNSNQSVHLHQDINEDIVGVFSAFQRSKHIMLLRDRSFLAWRFRDRPHCQHFYFTLSENSHVVATAIFKSDILFDNHALILMDFAYLPGHKRSLLKLIQYVRVHGKQILNSSFHFIFTAGHGMLFSSLKQLGFIPIPERLTPRPLHLLVKNLAHRTSEILEPNNWHVTLTDWDVF